MRRFQFGLAMLALPVFAAALFVAGCGKEEKKESSSSSSSSDTKDVTKTTGEKKPVTAKNGHVKGEIHLKGSAPNVDERTKALLAQIDQKKEDKDKCLMGSDSEKSQQTYRISGNKVGNVFVWLLPESGTYFKIDDKQLEEAKNHPVVIHQPHCAFIPHCAVLFSKYVSDPKKNETKATGQVLVIKNDAGMSHNTNWKGGAKNPGSNKTLPAGSEIKVDNLVPESGEVRFSCDIHKWMDGYLRVLDHPYATISHSDTLDGQAKVAMNDPKFGTFEMKNLPVGDLRIVAWHEAAGYLNKNGGKGQPIKIKEGEPTEINFDLEAK